MRKRGLGRQSPAVAMAGMRIVNDGLGALWRTLCLAALLIVPLFSAHVQAAGQGIQLIMVQETSCRFCRQWEKDIGHGYSNTPEGRFAPIRRVKRDAPEVKGLKPIVYTPTFIVMRGGEEVGRVTGYPGKDYFWPELDEVLSAAGFMRGL